MRGKDALDRRLPGFAVAARHGRKLLVLRDLDAETCPPALLQRLMAAPVTRLCLRIAVRTAEAWLMADRSGIAGALGVAISTIPRDPEADPTPKQRLRRIAEGARNRSVRAAFAGSDQQAQAWVADFIQTRWSPERGRALAPSLDKALLRLAALARS
ncbi:hypothetical protein [Roseomonas sp. CECT 9278]|uniref:hypothetical protein n=1 Tax=Roseomonas sp. CECT 9278 TaxID=2845823 RepID=UPI001E42FF0E|nr:hypothetical protein [Roseomonas sp. CECT 9278]